MKLKLKLVAAMALSLAALTGCAAEEAATETTTTTETAAAEETEAEVETETAVVEPTIVEEGNVKTSTIVDEKGDALVTEITFDEAGNPVDVQIDIIQANGVSKYESAAAGEYVMVEGSDNTWDKQIDAIEAAIKESTFDTTGIDAVTGVSITVEPVLDGVEHILGATTQGNVKTSTIVDDKGDALVTEITFDEAGNPVDVQIDIIQASGVSKYEAAAAGEYVMVEGSDNTWDKQIDAIEAAIKENTFDTTGMDAVTGVSIAVEPVLGGVQEILSSQE